MVNAIPIQSWRANEFGGLDLLRGTFITQVYSKHTHETYSIGILGHGAMRFACRGSQHTLHPGLIGVIHPDEVHTGHADGEDGWTYRNFYPEATVLEGILTELKGSAAQPPRLPVVIDDPSLAQQLLRAHRAFDQPASSLERESLLRLALTNMIARHAQRVSLTPAPGRERLPLQQVREMLEDAFAENLTLNQLAQVAGLNAFTLLRAFQRAYGLPPHAYQLQVRLRRAKGLLMHGETPAQVAFHTGFADQSHLGRHFRRAFGITPQQYRKGASKTF